jgi:hypothetical protein
LVRSAIALSEALSVTSAAMVVAPSTPTSSRVVASFSGLRAAAAQVALTPGARCDRYLAIWRPVTLVAPKRVTSMSRSAIGQS